MKPFWMSVFLDFAPDQFDDGVAHWERLTGWERISPRGEHGEYVGLQPSDGDRYLWTQRLQDGENRVHVDLHVDDPQAAAVEEHERGASFVAERQVQVLRSPGGLPFCYDNHRHSNRPAASGWPDGHSSIVDQVCIDIPAEHWTTETEFWPETTGWELQHSDSPEFARLTRPGDQPLQILLQRLDEATGSVRAHLDWATNDRATETERHAALGSEIILRTGSWTVMGGPGGIYCITDRVPDG
jgi:hypothetical protein